MDALEIMFGKRSLSDKLKQDIKSSEKEDTGILQKASPENETAALGGEVYTKTKEIIQTCEAEVNAVPAGFSMAVKEKMRKRYIAFDTETTGLSAQRDRIIELGAVLFENGEAVQMFRSLVNCHKKVPASASAVNHITNEMVQQAPEEETVYRDFVRFMGDALAQETIICAHNASFDMRFLTETLRRLGYSAQIRYVDTLSLSRKMVKGLPNYKQCTVCGHFGIDNENAHRACDDAKACGEILWELLRAE